jgi:hypothetical protein
MTISNHINETILLAASLKGLLLLLGMNFLNDNTELEDWLNDDGISEGAMNDPKNTQLVSELNRLKMKLRFDLKDNGTLVGSNGQNLSPLEIMNLIQQHKNRISKIRLMIENTFSIVKNTHQPSGVKYVVVRSYWIDKNGKKYRKFAKNIGAEDKVCVNGDVPESTKKSVYNEIYKMMQEEYKKEYPEKD